MDFGETFQKIREDKGLKRSELADEYVSASMIGKFERGESRLSFDRVVALVEKMQLSLNEFLYEVRHGEGQALFDREMIKFDPNGSTYQHSAKELHDFSAHLKSVAAQFPNDLSLRFGVPFFEIIAIEAYYKEQEKMFDIEKFEAFVAEKLRPIRTYLIKTETWGLADISLFALIAQQFDPDLRFELFLQAQRRLAFFRKLNEVHDKYYRLLFSLVQSSFYDERLDLLQKYLTYWEAEMQAYPDFLFNVLLDYHRARFKMAAGHLDEGQHQARDILAMMTPYYDKIYFLVEQIEHDVLYLTSKDKKSRYQHRRIAVWS